MRGSIATCIANALESGRRVIARARPAALAAVLASRGGFGARGLAATHPAELRHPFTPLECRGNERGNTQVEIETRPVQPTAAARDLDPPSLGRRSLREPRHELN